MSKCKGDKYVTVINDFIEYRNSKLYRIKALKDFGNVKKGDIGGYIRSYSNLSQQGNCWVYNNAKVYGDAYISDEIKIHGDSEISWGNWFSTIENCKVSSYDEYLQFRLKQIKITDL